MALAKTENIVLRGVGASPGIVIGQARVTDRSRVAVVELLVDREAIRHEAVRFQHSLAQVREDLLSLKRQLEQEKGPEHLYVIDTHLMILDDAMLTDETIACIQSEGVNAEAALKRTLVKFQQFFAGIEDEYLRERGADVEIVVE